MSSLAAQASKRCCACQAGNFANHDLVYIASNRVLEAVGSRAEIDGVLRGLSLQQGIDQASAEGVTRADPVNDVLHRI